MGRAPFERQTPRTPSAFQRSSSAELHAGSGCVVLGARWMLWQRGTVRTYVNGFAIGDRLIGPKRLRSVYVGYGGLEFASEAANLDVPGVPENAT